MDQRLSLVTLAVRDVATSRHFYVDGLGWEPLIEAPAEVLMLRVADGVVLSLWDEGQFADEVGAAPARDGVPPLTLAQNQASDEAVDAVLDDARAAGASDVTEAATRAWGGYSGYFADPDGIRWEIAHVHGEDSPINAVVLPR